MAKLDYSKIFIKEACPTSIGGQAVMEGVMMQGPERIALAMRLPSGELYLKTKLKPADPPAMKVPIVRGVVAFARSLINGMTTLMESADILEKYAPEEYAEEETRFEKWVNSKFGERTAWNILMSLSLVLAVVISIAIFVIFPTWVVNFLGRWISSSIVLNLIEGILRILIFIGYVVLIRRMEEINTLFRYHGAEHKTIHCYENNLELTPENAQQFYTLHPRCGTSFLVFVLIISLLLFSFLGWPNLILRIVSRVILIPVIAGLSYELLKWAGRSDNSIVRILSYPGLMLQKLTTAEPTYEQLEVGILSLKAVLVDKDMPVIEGFVDKDGNMIGDSLWKPGSKVMSQKVHVDEEEIGPADEDSINEAIKFLDGLDENGYTMVVLPSEDSVSLPQAIADHNKEEAKSSILQRRFTADIKTIENALSWGQAALSMVENGRNEARILLQYAAGLTQTEIITNSKELMDEEDFREYERCIHDRLTGTPLQYIVGMQEFMGLPITVNPSVLIPRLDTEVVVEEAIRIIGEKGWNHPDVLDMCTGSGVIGVTIAAKVPESIVTMTDVSEEALKTAMSNAGLNGVNRKCVFLRGDMFDALPADREYDMIICNPPYIETEVIDTLSIEVREHEPKMALDGGKDGLDFYRIIARDASMHLRTGGVLVLEIGADQAGSVKRLLMKSKTWDNIRKIQDMAGLDRAVIAERK
ncbi:MAG: peptide chain release factor N(5)-glutamine methyltransferase [Mogibacterium sp.]|nr:peptide chain release factor N(5)-glutamine methyltransferase [Mogibacterium sp.]